MASLFGRQEDLTLINLFEEFGHNIQRAGMLLYDLLNDYPERAELAREVLLCEQQGDRIAHDIIHHLNSNRHRRNNFEPGDLYSLATALDDIIDNAEHTADLLILYRVEATMEQAIHLAAVLVKAGEQVANALRSLRNNEEMTKHLVEIHRLENEGDRISRDALASLFAGGVDPMVVIRWKDIYESLEQAIDSCETVAHILEGISLKR